MVVLFFVVLIGGFVVVCVFFVCFMDCDGVVWLWDLLYCCFVVVFIGVLVLCGWGLWWMFVVVFVFGVLGVGLVVVVVVFV